jgi:hypothetical protein
MKKVIFILLILIYSISMSQIDIAKIESEYESVQVSSIKIRQTEMYEKINNIINRQPDLFTLELAGKSFLGKDISIIKLGTGKKKVLLWSQMHGDEPTATLATLDILNYFSKHRSDRNIKQILENCSIIFLPMLNPDGADLFTRRNAQDIDINRDALRLQTPEARILKGLIDKLKPDFGFNLHDQDPYCAVGNSDSLVTIALLAPAIDNKNTTNTVRKKAKQVTVIIQEILSKFVPGHVSKYDDEFEKRAFGDNIQLWGTSTILIESGGWYNDPGKDKIRKLNFLAILGALSSIADESFSSIDIQKYELIPFNKRTFYDLIIRNAKLQIDGFEYTADLGINYDKDYNGEIAKNSKGRIADLGDLSTSHGLEEFDAAGYQIKQGTYILLENPILKEVLRKKDSIAILLQQGITSIISEKDANLVGINNTKLNLFFLNEDRFRNLRMMLNIDVPVIPNPEFLSRLQDKCNINPFVSRDKIKINRYADLVFSKNDKVKIVFVNGIKVYDESTIEANNPGIIYLDK